MSDAAALIILIAAVVTATGAIFGALLWLVKPRFEGAVRDVVKDELKDVVKKDELKDVVKAEIAPIFTQLTENSHANLIPTIPDLISNVQHGIQRVLGDVDALDRKVDGLDSKVDGLHDDVVDVRGDLDRHLIDREEAKQLMRTIEAIALSQPPPDFAGPTPTTPEEP